MNVYLTSYDAIAPKFCDGILGKDLFIIASKDSLNSFVKGMLETSLELNPLVVSPGLSIVQKTAGSVDNFMILPAHLIANNLMYLAKEMGTPFKTVQVLCKEGAANIEKSRLVHRLLCENNNRHGTLLSEKIELKWNQ